MTACKGGFSGTAHMLVLAVDGRRRCARNSTLCQVTPDIRLVAPGRKRELEIGLRVRLPLIGLLVGAFFHFRDKAAG